MILVIGGTGTVGRHVVAELQARQAEVAVGSRNPERVKEVLGSDVRTIPLDLDDPASVARAVRSAEKVYLLTPGQFPHDEQARRVIDATREAGTRHVVRQSALAADVSPGYLIGRMHRETELYLLASGLTATILRPNHFMENTLSYADTIRSEGQFHEARNGARISHIATKDIGAVAAHVLTSEGYENQSFDLTGPEANSMAEVAEALSQATGQHITYVPVTEDQSRKMMSGMPEPLIEALLDLARFDREGGLTQTNHNVETIIGRPPQDYRAWAIEHATAFMPLPVSV